MRTPAAYKFKIDWYDKS